MQKKPGTWLHRLSLVLKRELRWFLPGLGLKDGWGWSGWYNTSQCRYCFFSFGFLSDGSRYVVAAAIELCIASFFRSYFTRDHLWFYRYWPGALGHLGHQSGFAATFCAAWSDLIDAVSAYHRREKGPRVVVIGGGMVWPLY